MRLFRLATCLPQALAHSEGLNNRFSKPAAMDSSDLSKHSGESSASGTGLIDSVTKKRLKVTPRTPKTAADPAEVQVLQEFTEDSGSVLANGWSLGKQLGAGLQGAVYMLKGEDGKDAGRVFKLVHHKMKAKVTGDLVLMEREWAIGRKLNLLNEEDGFLQGFMQTGSKVLDKDGSLLGIVLEKLNGQGVEDRFDDPKFNDINYILEMVKQVLEALDRARDAVGFRHGDMHIRNVMEHRIEAELAGAKPESDDVNFGQTVDLDGLHFKIIDYGHATVHKELAVDDETVRKAREYKSPDIPVVSTERIYRAVFHERDDVWRFMRSIGQAAEGRVWHEEDRGKVKMLMALIKETTGYNHRAHFARSIESGEQKKSLFERLMSVGSTLFVFKWLSIMFHAYFFPGRPQMTPKEALDYLESRRQKMGIAEKQSPSGSSK